MKLKVTRDDLAITLAMLSTVAALAGVAIGLQAQKDVVASTKFNAAISRCQESTDRYRRFFLKLVNSDKVPFDAYYPGETMTFERTKVDLIDSLNALSYSSSSFVKIVETYIEVVDHFDGPIQSPFLGHKKFEISKLGQYIKANNDLKKLSNMPGLLHLKCNEVLTRVRG